MGLPMQQESSDRKNTGTIADIKFEVLTAVKMSMFFFWVVTPCGFVYFTSALKMARVCFSEKLMIRAAVQPRTTTSI